MRGEIGASREKLVQKAVEVIGVRVSEQPAAPEKARCAQARLPARVLEGARLDLVAIGRVKKLFLERRDLGRAFETHQRLRPGFGLRLKALLFLDTGEGQLQRVGRRGLEASFPAAVEVDRGAVQLEQHAGRLDRARLATDV